MFRELSNQEAARQGLPSKSPLPPFEDVVWFGEDSDTKASPARVTPASAVSSREAA